MVDFAAPEIAVLESSAQRIGVFFRLDVLPDPVRLWLGIGHIDIVSDVRDPSGARYVGFGELRDVPVFNQVVNGRAERIEVGLSGVTSEMIQIFVEGDAENVKHKAADIGFGVFDAAWRLLGNIHWLRRGYVDYAAVSHDSGAGFDAPETRLISLSIGGLMTGRRRAGLSYWTNQDQQRLYPTDRFCERTVLMTEIEVGWPIFT